MEKLNELNKTNPTKNTKNKQKRRELVLLRRHMKKRLSGKLRRLHQKRKEDMEENEEEDEENKEYKPKQVTKTIEMMREKDETMIDETFPKFPWPSSRRSPGRSDHPPPRRYRVPLPAWSSARRNNRKGSP